MPWQSGGGGGAYSTPAWRRARAEALARARYRCEIAGPGCTGTATEVDHLYGIKADPQHRHLRAVCSTCHKRRTSQQSNRGHKQPPPRPRTQW